MRLFQISWHIYIQHFWPHYCSNIPRFLVVKVLNICSQCNWWVKRVSIFIFIQFLLIHTVMGWKVLSYEDIVHIWNKIELIVVQCTETNQFKTSSWFLSDKDNLLRVMLTYCANVEVALLTQELVELQPWSGEHLSQVIHFNPNYLHHQMTLPHVGKISNRSLHLDI